MKKRTAIIAAALVVALALTFALVACDKYEWKSIGAGDSAAEVESNGGYAVKQGKYLYYINGFDGTDGADNTFGTPVKQSIVRSQVAQDANGTLTVDQETSKVVVPKTVLYNSSSKEGGFAIYGEWIYYASPNYDKDKNGTASTTDVDIMRTKTDGSLTQNIWRISTRSARFFFTQNRVIYQDGTTLYYVDFSGMKTNKEIRNGKGAKSGTLAENVSGNALWQYGHDRIYFVRTVTESYKNYNELCSIKIDGSDLKVIATETTFLGVNGAGVPDAPEDNPQSVFKYSLVSLYIESDGGATLYYTKTHTTGSSDTADGFFCAKAADEATFKASEQHLYGSNISTLTSLGYDNGILASLSSGTYLVRNGQSPVKIIDGSQSIWYVDESSSTVYYTASSSATALNKISYDPAAPNNQSAVFTEGIKIDWLSLDFVGSNLVFFASDDSNYAHIVDVKYYVEEKDDEGNVIKTPYIGVGKPAEDEEE